MVMLLKTKQNDGGIMEEENYNLSVKLSDAGNIVFIYINGCMVEASVEQTKELIEKMQEAVDGNSAVA